MEVLKLVDLKAGHLVLPNTQLLRNEGLTLGNIGRCSDKINK